MSLSVSRTPYRISAEWARQLAFNAWGFPAYQTDFGDCPVVFVQPGITIFIVPIEPKVELDLHYEFDPTRPPGFETEEIRLFRFHDGINDETTAIGYGPKTNVLAVGETYGL